MPWTYNQSQASWCTHVNLFILLHTWCMLLTWTLTSLFNSGKSSPITSLNISSDFLFPYPELELYVCHTLIFFHIHLFLFHIYQFLFYILLFSFYKYYSFYSLQGLKILISKLFLGIRLFVLSLSRTHLLIELFGCSFKRSLIKMFSDVWNSLSLTIILFSLYWFKTKLIDYNNLAITPRFMGIFHKNHHSAPHLLSAP